MQKMQIILARVVKYDAVKHFPSSGGVLFVFHQIKVKKTTHFDSKVA